MPALVQHCQRRAGAERTLAVGRDCLDQVRAVAVVILNFKPGLPPDRDALLHVLGQRADERDAVVPRDAGLLLRAGRNDHLAFGCIRPRAHQFADAKHRRD